MPDGIKTLVLINLDIKLTDNSTFKDVKNIQAALGEKVKSQTPANTKRPLLTPMTNEIVLPFLKPMKPPNMRKSAKALRRKVAVILNGW
jgi:hypothetical protein